MTLITQAGEAFPGIKGVKESSLSTVKAPNFLIVGAAKSGTTSLYHYINGHPEVFMPKDKEPMFFVSNIYSRISRNDPRHPIADRAVVTRFEDYLKLFGSAQDGVSARGEASAAYLFYHETAIPAIKRCLGDIKIIIILRNPIDRAFSSYCHLVRDGVESRSFEAFLAEESRRRHENWDILNFPKALGLYYEQVKAYLDAFSEVKVLLLDELKAERAAVLRDVFAFLEIDEHYTPPVQQVFNNSGRPKNQTLHRLISSRHPLKVMATSALKKVFPEHKVAKLKSTIKGKNTVKPKIDPQTREELKQFFVEDLKKTQDLIGKDLSHWLN